MQAPPRWFMPVAILALLWNLLGCFAYLSDVMLKPEDIAKMTAAQQAMYHARPAWSVGATAFAVWFGALGCVALILKKRWALPVLVISLLGCLVQDASLFMLSGAAPDATALGLQGFVLVVAVALVWLARTGSQRNWLG
ncbi:MAG: hypothetical protein HY275_15660 [Gemmatimonadetes bacterium]|nr:hypothetical protein [Gemmatimonadota bacterium]